MIKKWYNTNAAEAAGMLDVSNQLILEWSNGEVNKMEVEEEDTGAPGTLTDPHIFGDFDDGKLLMGHITLPCPVVNIRYVRGPRPELPRMLGMHREDIEKVIYMSDYIVVDPGDTGLKEKQLIPEKEYMEKNLSDSNGVLLMGAEAVEALLKKEGKDPSGVVLRHIPVLPLEMRYGKIKCPKSGSDAWAPRDLELLYARLLNRSCRLDKLGRMRAPEIIIRCETRMLQEYVDSLVDNGLRGRPTADYDGSPLDSLAELYNAITSLTIGNIKHPGIPEGYERIPAEKVQDALDAFHKVEEKMREVYPEGEFYEGEDPELDQAGDAFASLLDPLSEALVRKYFAPYEKDFHDELVNAARVVPTHVIHTYDPKEDGVIEERCILGMYKQMQFFVKKGAKYAGRVHGQDAVEGGDA